MRKSIRAVLFFPPLLILLLSYQYRRISALPLTPDSLVEELFSAMSRKNATRIRMLCSPQAFAYLDNLGNDGDLRALLSADSLHCPSSWDVWKEWAEQCGVDGVTSRPIRCRTNPRVAGISDRWMLFSITMTDEGSGWYISNVIGLTNIHSGVPGKFKLDKPFVQQKWMN